MGGASTHFAIHDDHDADDDNNDDNGDDSGNNDDIRLMIMMKIITWTITIASAKRLAMKLLT